LSFGQSDSTYVTFKLSAPSAFLVIDEDYSNCIAIQNEDRLLIENGTVHFRILSKYYYDSTPVAVLEGNYEHSFIINQQKIEKLRRKADQSNFARCFWDSNVFVLSEQDAKVSIDGQKIAYSSFQTSLPKGTHKITTQIQNKQSTYVFDVHSFNYIKNYIRPKRSTIYARSLVPGFSQITKGELIKGSVIAGAITLLGVNSIIYHHRMVIKKDHYQNLKMRYNKATDPNEILHLIEQSEQVLDDVSRYNKIRNIYLYGLGLAYLSNILDGIRPPKLGFRAGELQFNPYIDFDKNIIPKVNLNIDF
jgi:hypothetical protein